jgi:hypothetical protein
MRCGINTRETGFLLVAAFLLGIWIRGLYDERIIIEESRRHLISGVTWAIESGYLTVNQERVREMDR